MKKNKMKAPAEWFEAFFGRMYGRVLAASFTPERTLAQARLVRRLLRLRKGERVLDIPCGQGRLTVPLAKAGLDMTGVDFNAAYLRAARAAARPAGKGLRARFLRCDMRRIEFDAQFDAAFNWFTSIGYFSDEDELEFCRRALRSLRPGGRFLVETINRRWIQKRFIPRGSQKVGGVDVFQRHRWDPSAGRTDDAWTFRHRGRMERHRISLRLYGGAELRALLKAAGFTDIRLYGSRPQRGKGRPPLVGRLTRCSPRLIAVCRRPG